METTILHQINWNSIHHNFLPIPSFLENNFLIRLHPRVLVNPYIYSIWIKIHILLEFLYLNFSKNRILSKQWPLAPNSPKWRITRANVSRRVTFFSKMAFGECERMYRVRGKWLANVGRMSGECRANVSSPGKVVGECRANVSSPTKTGWQLSAQVR